MQLPSSPPCCLLVLPPTDKNRPLLSCDPGVLRKESLPWDPAKTPSCSARAKAGSDISSLIQALWSGGPEARHAAIRPVFPLARRSRCLRDVWGLLLVFPKHKGRIQRFPHRAELSEARERGRESWVLAAPPGGHVSHAHVTHKRPPVETVSSHP